MTRDNFAKKANILHRDNKYSDVWKDATTEYHSNQTGPTPTKKGFGAGAVAAKYNQQLTSPGDKQVGRTALMTAVAQGRVGVSPQTRGRPPILPKQLSLAIATHATMMQVSGEAEASGSKMKATIQALAMDTEWENKVDPEYVWRKTRTLHPDILNPVQAKNHEDRQADWLTYANINLWTDGAKDYLIKLGMLKDEPGEICKFIF